MSFGKQKEFSTIPNARYSRLNSHKYNREGIDLLKLATIYGANASGKSNFVKAILFLKHIVVKGSIPTTSKEWIFKLKDVERSDIPTVLGIEFITEKGAYLYAIEIKSGIILREELYSSGLGKSDDELLFERITQEGDIKVKFPKEFYSNEENKLLLRVLEKNMFKSNQPIIKILSQLENEYFELIKDAWSWFEESLFVIKPKAKVKGIAEFIDETKESFSFAKDLLCTYHVGIIDLEIEKLTLNQFFGEDNKKVAEKVRQKLIEKPDHVATITSDSGEEVVAVNEKGKIIVKRLKILHEGNKKEFFYMDEESDGTRRLLDFIPAIYSLVNENAVYIIDEIERSLHPIIIKEIIKKFSLDPNTKGQLIFTTHESNLLDQDILRKDEIWFSEKDFSGCTDLYSLSKFKEHPTIDIRRGYLNGRYGGIPFTGNLEKLNWHIYDSIEE